MKRALTIGAVAALIIGVSLPAAAFENDVAIQAAFAEPAADAQDLFKRLTALPGYGKEKAKIFMALLAKRFGIKPAGWEEAAAPFSDAERRSIADVESPETLLEVRAWKKTMKAQGKGKAD